MSINCTVREMSLWESKYVWANVDGNVVSQSLLGYLLRKELESM